MPASEILLRAAWRAVRSGWDVLLGQAIPAITAPLGYLRPRPQIVQTWPTGNIPLGPNVVLFAHFDAAGAFRPHVLRYVTMLGEAGLSVVVVSNAGALLPAAMAALQNVCAGVILRRNIGYDFGAWRDALTALGLPRPDTQSVTLANDSIYGPLAPLQPIIQRLDFTQADVWGLTDSWQVRYHLQSYFLCCGRAVLDSPEWRQFWSDVRPLPSKHSIIRRYEIGLSQALIRAGFRCRAIWPYTDLLARIPMSDAGQSWMQDDGSHHVVRMKERQLRRVLDAAGNRRPLNPTSDLWRQLAEAKYPFIKRELLRDNPTRVADLAEWREVMKHTFDANLDAIDRDLERTLRHRAP